ncbi:MAG: Gfo/Idh/MocA family oxidoreductase [Gemmatimonadaceae bacterium]|nr:Gfo/Idh/MocA family oxidoreductase [Gemmatimonadaceae bacterium]NUO95892.1 Gfo/Idh/MocA family oxidoreductase [Gemmatimonadaceae bacterium]NUP69943.1 Gfo/Idh/MocA family oxidoreductase [Gemmatimonadaceae bacterium]NUR32625.1 Gfo/Idh/MocA family oxidoreductase [Gemmatimonadaceae bacterium]NUS34084.1 Gfo/Idh/MocA family oxidoreductase [Gemmatimonadaceae bacterium]
MTEPVHIGVVGAGAIAQLAHLPVLGKMRGAKLVAVCDNDRPKARALADRFDIEDVYTDIEDLLEAEDLRAIVVATPNHLHEPHVLSAIAAGKDVLCERPLALTARGVERIVNAAARANRKVFVANNHRFRSDVQALAGFLRGGELGKLTGIRAGAYHHRRAEQGWRQRRAEAGGGAFFDYGLPLLDLALWLADFPAPERVVAHMERGSGKNAVEDSLLVQVHCGSAVFNFDVSGAYVGEEERWWFETLSTRGSTRLAPLRVVKELHGRPTDVSPRGAAARESAFIQSYRAELAHFVSVVAGETEYEAPTDQVIVHRTVEAIYKSADEGREIKL